MREFFLRRLIQVLPTVLGLLVLIFVVSRVIPGDPVRLALGPEATKEQITTYQEKLGLDRPLPAQFGHYVAGLLRGDLGESIRTYRDVRLDIRDFLPATVELVTTALLVAVCLGVPFGILSAMHPNTWIDNLSRLVAVPGVALPRFWVGILLQVGLAYQLGLFPIVGRASRPPQPISGLYLLDAALTGDGAAFLDAARHLALAGAHARAAHAGPGRPPHPRGDDRRAAPALHARPRRLRRAPAPSRVALRAPERSDVGADPRGDDLRRPDRERLPRRGGLLVARASPRTARPRSSPRTSTPWWA